MQIELTEINAVDGWNRYRVSGSVNGELTIYLDEGAFNGYEWNGDQLTDDGLQAVLDLLEADW